MKKSCGVLQFIKSISLPSIFLVGGLITAIWLTLTPPGIFGKGDAIGYSVCHQIDVRSFHIGAKQLPLCVRCTGQYLGAVIGLTLLMVFGKRKSGFPPKNIIIGMILLALIYLVDGLNSYLYLPPFVRLFPWIPHLYLPSNTLRLITGTGMGLVIALVIYPAFWGSVVPDPDTRPVIENLLQFGLIISAGILVDLLILNQSVFVLLPAALISTVGVLLMLTMVYTILWLYWLGKENRITEFSKVSKYAFAGFLTAMIQIALIDLIRFIITGTWNGLFFD